MILDDELIKNENPSLKAPVFILNPRNLVTKFDEIEKNSNNKIIPIDIENTPSSTEPVLNIVFDSHKKSLFDEILFTGDMKNTQNIIKNEAHVFVNSVLHRNPELKSFIFFLAIIVDVILRGISQVFLCNHPISGIFILIGLAFSHINYVLYAILGTFFSTFSSLVIGGYNDHILAGLSGYDGALVGCACYNFLDSKYALGATILLSFLVGIVHLFCVTLLAKWELPAFTLGFNIVTMLTLLSIKGGIISWEPNTSSTTYDEEALTQSWFYFLDTTFRGVGQFMFAHTTLGSFFVVLGIAISSRRGALAAMGGSIVGAFTSRYIFNVVAKTSIHAGLFGYNCAGVSSALVTIFLVDVKHSNGPYDFFFRNVTAVILSSVLCTLITIGVNGMLNGLPNLTIPFITSAWIMILTNSHIYIPQKIKS